MKLRPDFNWMFNWNKNVSVTYSLYLQANIMRLNSKTYIIDPKHCKYKNRNLHMCIFNCLYLDFDLNLSTMHNLRSCMVCCAYVYIYIHMLVYSKRYQVCTSVVMINIHSKSFKLSKQLKLLSFLPDERDTSIHTHILYTVKWKQRFVRWPRSRDHTHGGQTASSGRILWCFTSNNRTPNVLPGATQQFHNMLSAPRSP